jgi:hypothetical protein
MAQLGSNTSGHLFDTSFTTDGVLYSDANGVITSTAAGNAGQVLTSNGAGVAPTYQAAGGGSATAFYAYLTTQANNVTGDGTVWQAAFDATGFDTATAFTTGGSAHFTAPTTGYYSFSWNIQCTGVIAQTFTIVTFVCNFNTAGTTFKLPTPWAGAGIESYTGSIIVSMTAGDTAYLNLNLGGSTKTVSVTGAALPTESTFFSGFLIK